MYLLRECLAMLYVVIKANIIRNAFSYYQYMNFQLESVSIFFVLIQVILLLWVAVE